MSSATPESTTSVPINVNGDKHICRNCERTFHSNRGLTNILEVVDLRATWATFQPKPEK